MQTIAELSIPPLKQAPIGTSDRILSRTASSNKSLISAIYSSLFAGASLAKYLHEQSIPYMVSEHLKEFIIADGWTAFQKVCINSSYNYASRIIATSAALKNNIQSLILTHSLT